MKKTKTKDISNELSKRPGVKRIDVDPHEEIKIQTGHGEFTSTGPAIILINQD
jgi:hypothetical protein